MDFQELDSKIAELERQSREAERNPHLWKNVWEQIKHIGSGFKGIRYPSPTEHQTAWSRFQNIVSTVKEAQQRQKSEGEKNERRIRKELDSLSSTVNSANSGRPDW
jgi:hypothetical protein